MSRALTPTAPSATDPRFTTIVSSSGFSAGDYVYQRPDGTYGPVANGAVTTASFNADQTLPNLGADVSVYAGYRPLSIGGTSRLDMAAKLSNGNIVIVYTQLTTVGGLLGSRAIFTIVDSAGATVVAPTQVSSTIIPQQNNVSVVALTGGGFVLYFVDSTTYKPTFGVYTNTGAVTTALAVDTAATTVMGTSNGYSVLYACALPNGGFAFAYPSSSNTILTRAYDSAGTGTYAWTNLGGTQVSLYQSCRIAARSDNTTAVIFCTTTANQFRITRVSTSGTATDHSFTVTSQAGTSQNFDICCLSNDTFVGVYYNNPGNNVNIDPRFITLPTSNVLGTPVSVQAGGAVMTFNAASPTIYVTPLSSGGFIVFFSDSNGMTYYVPYNSSGVAQNVGTNVPCFGELVAFGPAMHPAFIETSGYLDIYYAIGNDNLASGGATPTQYYNFKSTMELTDYTIYSPSSTNTIIGTTTQPVTNYARIGSTPTNAAFFPTTTGAVAVNLARSSITLSSRQVDSSFAPAGEYFALATNATGQILVVYKASTSSALRAVLYSNTGTLIRAITVATWTLSGTGTVDAAFLSNGKIVIVEGRTSNLSNIYVYDSTLSTLLASSLGVYTAQGGKVAVAGLTGDIAGRFVFVHINASGYASYSVFSDTLAVLQSSTNFDSNSASSTNQLSVCALASGGFAARWYSSTTSTDRSTVYSEYTTNGWAVQFTRSDGSTANYAGGKLVVSNNTGTACIGYGSSTGVLGYLSTFQSGVYSAIINQGVTVETSVVISGKFSMGVTGSGIPVIVNANASSAGINIINMGVKANAPTSTLSTITDYAATPYTNVAPWFGNNVVVGYISSSTRINIAILNAAPYSFSETLTVGVTPSNSALTLNPSSSSGYTMIGVAATDCAAGGAGQVQVNGVATLNSQYSTATTYQGFDFQVPGNRGVRGTVAGNVVTLIGDA